MNPTSHGIIDYLFASILLLLPNLLGETSNLTTLLICRTLGVTVVILSVFTDYPLGVIRALRYRTHLVLDCLLVILLAASVPLFELPRNVDWALLGMGIVGLGITFLSARELPGEFEEEDYRGYRGRERDPDTAGEEFISPASNSNSPSSPPSDSSWLPEQRSEHHPHGY